MVKLKFNGGIETFFHFKGTKYKTEKFIVDVPEEVANFVLTNNRWSKVSYAKNKKNNEVKK